MSATTTRAGLYKAGGGLSGLNGTDETADIDKAVNDNLDKIDALLGLRPVTSTTRPGTPIDGQLIYETDTKIVRFWRAATTTWERVTLPDGLVPIVPTSVDVVTGTSSQSTPGAVNVVGVLSARLNGVFTSVFDRYVVKVQLTRTAVVDLNLRLSAAGVNAAGADYGQSRRLSSGATVTGDVRRNTTEWRPDEGGLPYADFSVELINPAKADVTIIRGEWSTYDPAQTLDIHLRSGNHGGGHKLSTAYDGLYLEVPSGLFTGNIRVFGYSTRTA